MLVLTRQKNETIIIGDNVEITILEIHHNHVKLGISAPSKIPVHRKEIYIAIKEENIKASASKITPSQLDKLKNIIAKEESLTLPKFG